MRVGGQFGAFTVEYAMGKVNGSKARRIVF